MLDDRRRNRVYAPERLAVPLPAGGHLFIMPAADGELAITKVVSVHPGNGTIGLATTQGEVIVMEAGTGRRLRLLDGNVVTARRTAALSVLAAEMVAPDTTGALLVVGAGVQARSHLDAFAERFGPSRVYIASRGRERARALAHAAHQAGISCEVIADVARALDHTTMIVTATSSAVPVIGDGVRDDAFIAAVGAHRPETTELGPELVRRSRLYVDTLEGARAEAGDLIQSGVDWEQVIALQDALDRPKPTSGPVIFKSVGHALWDLAAARVIESQLAAGAVI